MLILYLLLFICGLLTFENEVDFVNVLPNESINILNAVQGRVERGSFTLTLSQNRAWKSPLTRLFTLNSLCIDITLRSDLSQMVLLLSSYPPLCLRVVQFKLLECVTPFAPCPLQTLQRYYGAIRHRSGLRYVSALFVTFGISLGIPTSASHVPPTSLYYCPATSMPHAAMP